MYISQLSLHGFKSFVKKGHLQFGEGITVIVGPNGCGKTNIVDAIRWVLGEQKYSVLRGGRMQDVIFNGTEKLKPLNVCEASLTVHNNKGKLPLEYNDIEITRRLYRDGESQYFLNRTPCRLKDIQDLFVDTGMGADAYSVIELKMIEQILSDTAGDRKRMFEEAAGINKYKHQRRSALRKLEAVKWDLGRVDDITLEVEQKVRSLALQLKRFQRHTRLNRQLQEAEMKLAWLQVQEYRALLEPLREQIAAFSGNRESRTREETRQERELARLRQAYQEQQEELATLQAELDRQEARREEARNDLLVGQEQARAAEANLNRLNREKENNTRRRVQLDDHLQDYTREIARLEPGVEQTLQAHKEGKRALEGVEERYRKDQDAVDQIHNQRWEAQQELAQQVALLQRTESRLEEKKAAATQLETKLQKLKTLQDQGTTEQTRLEKGQQSLVREVGDLEKNLAQLEQAREKKMARHHRLTLEQNSHQSRAEALATQLQFYRELVERKEGYPRGARFILENEDLFPDVLGTVADLFQVEEEYQRALESGLGDLVHCLVTRNRQVALTTLQKARHEKAGKVAIIPLKEVAGIATNHSPLPSHQVVIGRASELVAVPKNLQPLADFLIGNLLVVNDLPRALQETALEGWNLVDLEGAYSGTNYLLKHSQGSNGTGVVGRQKKITTLSDQIDRLNANLTAREEKLARLEREITALEGEYSSPAAELAEQRGELDQVEKELLRNQYSQSQSQESIDSAAEELQATREACKQLTESLQSLRPVVQRGETRISRLIEKGDQARQSLEETRLERDHLNRQVQEQRIELLNLENQREKLSFQRRTAAETIAELEGRQAEIEDEIQELKDRSEALAGQLDSDRQTLTKVQGKIRHQRSVLDLKRQAAQELYQSLGAVQARIRSAQQDREALLEELRSREVQVLEMEQKINLVMERIRDRYATTLPETMSVKHSTGELNQEIERLGRSIERIGPVNMAVKEEHEEESQRLKLLEEQQQDLLDAEENLRQTIQRIDRIARQLFLETFDQIKYNFENLFSLFFEGGSASLSLAGDPDPLEADIAIQACPPGKRNQNLRILSAGEKSLTAIALLFAIYQYKPSPYCILDEVDAPLDDMNIKKFTRVLNQFAEETQFIVVTHNKLTMEAANFFYGVTMEEKGVSKLVSVKFDHSE